MACAAPFGLLHNTAPSQEEEGGGAGPEIANTAGIENKTELTSRQIGPARPYSVCYPPLFRRPCSVGELSNGGLEAGDRRPCRYAG
jgi:hypothetical protein